jgi:hypothetical protein
MSRPSVIDEPALRLRLAAALEPGAAGSLYLRTLACAYLACDEEAEAEELALETLFEEQARVEDIDGHELLGELIAAGTGGPL